MYISHLKMCIGIRNHLDQCLNKAHLSKAMSILTILNLLNQLISCWAIPWGTLFFESLVSLGISQSRNKILIFLKKLTLECPIYVLPFKKIKIK